VLAGVIEIDEWRIQRIQSLFASCGERISTDYARRLADTRQIVYRQSRRALPGAVDLLHLLKERAKIGIVTNNFTKEQEDKLAACGLTPLIDVLVTSEAVHYAKPEPEIFRAAWDQLGCDASQAVMVGDSWEGDVIGALNSGIRAVWLNRYNVARPGPEDVLEIASFEPAELVAAQIMNVNEL